MRALPSGWTVLRGALWIVATVVAGVALFTAFLAIAEPWNRSLYLWPTLTGSWYGEVAIPGRRTQIIRLELTGDTENPPVQGTATTCDARGDVTRFDIRGGPRNWRGSRFWIQPVASAQLAGIEGEWAGDTMHASATIGHASGPVPFILRRGNRQDFVSACQRLRVNP